MNKNLNIDEIIHPEDKAALESLQGIPGFETALKWFMKHYSEQSLHGINLGCKLRLGSQQIPNLYNLLPPVCSKLGIKEPEFYLELSPGPNAYTFGDSRAFITVTSGLVQNFELPEIVPVIAHECGHIICRHVLYHTLGRMVFGGIKSLVPLPAAVTSALGAVFTRWERMSELSADRVAAVMAGNPESIVTTMARLSGASKNLAGSISLKAYLDQAQEYERLKSGDHWNEMLQSMAVMEQNHPFPAVRATEIMKWGKTETFKRITKALGTYSPVCESCGASLEATQRICRKCGRPV